MIYMRVYRLLIFKVYLNFLLPLIFIYTLLLSFFTINTTVHFSLTALAVKLNKKPGVSRVITTTFFSGNKISQSFIDATSDLVRRHEPISSWSCTDKWAIDKLKEVCIGPLYPWLICVQRPSSLINKLNAFTALIQQRFICAEGANGVVIKVEINNEPEKYNIEIYENANSRRSNTLEADFDTGRRIDPNKNKRVEAVMKFIKPAGEERNMLLSLNTKRSLHQKEVERGRAMARLLSTSGTPFTGSWYDIKDMNTQNHHQIGKTAFFSQAIDGLPALDLLRVIMESESLAMTMGLNDLNYLNEKYLKARIVYYRQKKNITDDYQQEKFRRTETRALEGVDTILAEVLLRARFRLTLLDSILAFAEELAKQGLAHCDLHMTNILIRCSRCYTSKCLTQDILNLGHTVLDPTKLHMSMDTVKEFRNPGWETEFKKGISLYPLNVNNLRVIDTSHSLNITSVISHYYRGTKNNVIVPCRIERAQKDDIFEIFRAIDLCLTLKTYRQERPVETYKPLATRWKIFLNRARRNNPALQNQNGQSDALQQKLLWLDLTFQKIDTFYLKLHSEIMNISSLKQCEKMETDYFNKIRNMSQNAVLSSYYSKNVTERLKHWKALSFQCTVATAEDAVSSARQVLALKAKEMTTNLLKTAQKSVTGFKLKMDTQTGVRNEENISQQSPITEISTVTGVSNISVITGVIDSNTVDSTVPGVIESVNESFGLNGKGSSEQPSSVPFSPPDTDTTTVTQSITVNSIPTTSFPEKTCDTVTTLPAISPPGQTHEKLNSLSFPSSVTPFNTANLDEESENRLCFILETIEKRILCCEKFIGNPRIIPSGLKELPGDVDTLPEAGIALDPLENARKREWINDLEYAVNPKSSLACNVDKVQRMMNQLFHGKPREIHDKLVKLQSWMENENALLSRLLLNFQAKKTYLLQNEERIRRIVLLLKQAEELKEYVNPCSFSTLINSSSRIQALEHTEFILTERVKRLQLDLESLSLQYSTAMNLFCSVLAETNFKHIGEPPKSSVQDHKLKKKTVGFE